MTCLPVEVCMPDDPDGGADEELFRIAVVTAVGIVLWAIGSILLVVLA